MIVAAFVGGLVLWTVLEYVLHRFAGHSKLVGKRVRKEHFMHHATPDYFTSLPRKLVLAVPVLGGLAAIAVPLFGWGAGLALVAGTAAGWTFYEHLHKATHVRGPLNAYGAWARRHHLHHHFQSPKANHGVTTPLWDWVFGTLERPETITVPRRHVRCFAWILDGDEVAEEYRDLYRVV
ncbi:MAG TPA: sterol desaturase family protein [Sandaracinaceae bacterium LLY-WYZ-13_1]|nr:sterol desaturase family protein [Sandaracinaceae bacterium LLY-WYZ-13_1]